MAFQHSCAFKRLNRAAQSFTCCLLHFLLTGTAAAAGLSEKSAKRLNAEMQNNETKDYPDLFTPFPKNLYLSPSTYKTV